MYKELYGFIFAQSLLFLEILGEVAFVTILKNEIEIVGSLFDVIKLDDIFIIASLEYLDLVFEQLHEFT